MFAVIAAGVEKPNGTYTDLFAERLKLSSSERAIVNGDETVSYGELDERAGRIAQQLLARGMAPESLVGVHLERSVSMVASMLGIWKAGGAYLPLDPATPASRIAQLIDRSSADLIITNPSLSGNLPSGRARLILDEQVEQQSQRNYLTPPRDSSSETLAYVIYTSGSTGEPQGVEISHGSLLHHNVSVVEAFRLQPNDRVLQFASLAFDLSVEEIFPTLLAGATLVLRSEDCIASIPRFLNFVRREKVSVLNLPTAFWHQLVYGLGAESLPSCVRLVVIGGEKASDQAWKRWQAVVQPGVRLINTYGPTETTVTATLCRPHLNATALDIGLPLGNTEVYILDAQLQQLKRGETGELFIGGPGVARGYRENPTLTKQRFVEAPASLQARSNRLYKTGDLVRELANGNLQFVGRNDQQVKIRGYRVEPAEITAAILEYPGIQDAAVVVRGDSENESQLVGYYAAGGEQTVAPFELRRFLVSRLPEYLLPAALVPLVSIPRNTSGKLALTGLPVSGAARPDRAGLFIAPNGAVESELAAIWQEVLHLDAVGAQDNFFDIGGDSLRAVQVASRVRERFNIDVPLSTVLDGQTIAAMARRISEQGAAPERSAKLPLQHSHECPASFVQERLWFLHCLNPSSDAYNVPFALRLKGRLDLSALARAVQTIISRHDVLRTTLHEVDGQVMQRMQADVPVASLDLGPFRVPSDQALQRLLMQEARVCFDLEKGPLFRTRLIRCSRTVHVLLVVAHHAVFDGWSVGLFINELQSLYEHLVDEGLARNPASPVAQYAHYAQWQRQHMQGAALEKELSWWKKNLQGARGEIQLAPNTVRPPSPTSETLRLTCKLSPAKARRLRQAARRARTTPFAMLLTALGFALYQLTGQDDLVIGTVVAGRTRSDFERLLGCFNNFLPLRIRVSESENLSQLLRQTSRVVIEAQSHQECPFERIVSALNPDRGTANPLYNVALVWQEFPVNVGAKSPRLAISSMDVFTHSSLLDLRVEVEPAGAAMSLNYECNPQAISAERMQALIKLWLHALAELTRRPGPFAAFRRLARRSSIGGRVRGALRSLRSSSPGWL